MYSPKAKLGPLAENHEGKVGNLEYGERYLGVLHQTWCYEEGCWQSILLAVQPYFSSLSCATHTLVA